MMAPGDDADQGIPVAPACWRCAKPDGSDWPDMCRTCWEREFGDIWWHASGEIRPHRPSLSAQFLVAVALLLAVAVGVAMGMAWR